MKSFFRFMAGSAGRVLRIILGLSLIVWGVYFSPDVNWVLIVVGMIPFLAGAFDVCVFAPLFGFPFNGKALRAEVSGV